MFTGPHRTFDALKQDYVALTPGIYSLIQPIVTTHTTTTRKTTLTTGAAFAASRSRALGAGCQARGTFAIH